MEKDQLEILQHSLGLDAFGEGRMFRNHFVAAGADLVLCRALCEAGHMSEHRASAISGCSPVFTVTTAGIAAVRELSPKRPVLSAGRRRYLQWLSLSDCFDISFSHFLKNEKAILQTMKQE